MDLASRVRSIPDFPVAGILFRDITTVISDGPSFQQAVDAMLAQFRGVKIDKIAAIEARGWVFAAPMAYKLGVGFALIRKPGKLPYDTISCEYTLEYGTNALEIHADAINPGENVLIVDDLLATGGTAHASIELVERLGGKVAGLSFLIELAGLKGREQLAGYRVESVIIYEGA